MNNKPRPVDFDIVSKPVEISLTCPYCDMPFTIPWNELDPPDYWGDQWDPVTCPDCGKQIELGDYTYS